MPAVETLSDAAAAPDTAMGRELAAGIGRTTLLAGRSQGFPGAARTPTTGAAGWTGTGCDMLGARGGETGRGAGARGAAA